MPERVNETNRPAAVKPESDLRRWWRGLGVPSFKGNLGFAKWYSWVLLDGYLIGEHAIEPDDNGELGRIETGVYLDRRTLFFALLRGRLSVRVQHHVWGAQRPGQPTDDAYPPVDPADVPF